MAIDLHPASRARLTAVMSLVLFVFFVVLYFASEPAGAMSKGWVLSAAILFAGHAFVVFVNFLLLVIRSAHELDPERVIGRITFVRLGLLLLLLISQYAVLYAADLEGEPGAYESIPPDAPRSMRLRRMLFLATETSMNLGSGAIIARQTSEGPFILLACNSLQSWVLTVVVVSELIEFSRARRDFAVKGL